MKYLLVLLSFVAANVIFALANMYQVKYIKPTILNLLIYNSCLIPAYLLANILITTAYNKGYAAIERIWPITIMYLAAGVAATVLITLVFIREIPKPNVIIGFVIALVGIIIANYK